MMALELPRRVLKRVRASQAHARLEREFARVMSTRRPMANDGPRIGIATFGSGGWHFVLEALLAHALGIRGARPQFLVCDLPDLPICDERTICSHHRERCDGCVDDKRGLLDSCGLPWRGISAFVAPESLPRARAVVAGLDDGAIEGHVERGWPVGEWLHVSACHYLRCDARGASPDRVDTRRRLLVTAIVVVEAVTRWLDETQPEIVVVESGAHLVWRIALELARARGLRVICREIGKGGWDSHIYALNADCMAPDFDAAWSTAKDEALTAAEDGAIDQYLLQLPLHTYPQIRPVERATPESLRASLGLPAGARTAVAFTNVSWDLATAGRDVAFDGMFDWLRETVNALSLTTAHLVVRVHPAEASVLTREKVVEWMAGEWPRLPANVTIIPPDDTTAARDVIGVADLVLAYNSSVAIDAAAAGRRVVVAGAPHYRGRGFTEDVASRDDYRDLLRRWSAGEQQMVGPDQAAVARRYAHLFFLRYHVRMKWTTSPLEPPFHLLVRSLDELVPGVNPWVDEVCRSILEGRQVLLPRAAAEGVQ